MASAEDTLFFLGGEDALGLFVGAEGGSGYTSMRCDYLFLLILLLIWDFSFLRKYLWAYLIGVDRCVCFCDRTLNSLLFPYFVLVLRRVLLRP